MTPKESEERYDKGGKTLYLVYETDQRLRDGSSQPRERVKRFYVPGDSRAVSVGTPRSLRKRTGRRVHGVEVHYEHRLAGATAQRGNTKYELPERWAERTKVIEMPDTARNVRLTANPPEGPKMAVA
jgi:hypothetical protein